MAGMWMSFSGKRPGGLFAAAIFAAGALAAGVPLSVALGL